jgi:threonine/homoserine/homoserine lactone efflux protein
MTRAVVIAFCAMVFLAVCSPWNILLAVAAPWFSGELRHRKQIRQYRTQGDLLLLTARASEERSR